MLLNPSPSSRSGLSTQGTLLLALAGASVALFLLFLLPRISDSRAAAPRRILPDEPETAARSAAGTASNSGLAAAELLPVKVSEAESTTPAAADLASASADLSKNTEEAQIEGPKLRIIKGDGKPAKIEHGALRAEQRERRKARLEAEAAEAQAMGTPPPATQAAKPAPNPNRSRLEQKSDKEKLPGHKNKKKPKQG